MTRVLILVIFLSGCTSIEFGKDECGYSWQKDTDEVPEYKWTYIYASDIYLVCAFEAKAESCAIRRDGGCLIVLPEPDKTAPFCKSDEYYRHHEGLHCKGFVHPTLEF